MTHQPIATSPSPSEFTRGWRQIVTAMLCLGLGSTGLFQYTQGLFYVPLEQAFGWSRGQVASMTTAFNLAFAVSAPLVGLLVDRFGVRRVSATAILCMSGGFWLLSRLHGSLIEFAVLMIFIGLTGPGTSGAPNIRLVAGWFERQRGLAIGITMTGTGLAAALAPRLLGSHLQTHDWRQTYALMALLALASLPLVLLFASEHPRDHHAPDQAMDPPGVRPPLPGLSLPEALRTGRFWLLGAAFFLSSAAVAGFMPHFIPLLQDNGMSVSQAGQTFGVLGTAVIIGRLLTGYLCDRFFAPYVAVAIFALSLLGFAGLSLWGVAFAWLAALLIGLGLGAEVDLLGYMTVRYFGLRNFTAILGFLLGLFGVGAGVGLMMFGRLYDHFGDYRVGLFTAATLLLISLPLLLRVGPYWQEAAAAPAH